MANFRTITGFKSKLQGGGARPNLFEVNIPNMPNFVTAYDNEAATTFSFLCKAASLPGSNVNVVEVPFRGRTLKVSGDRTFSTWTITVINDEDFKIRSAFEQWMNGINQLSNGTGATNPTSYMRDATVHQLGRGATQGKFSTQNDPTTNVVSGSNPTPLRTYTFKDIFPTTVTEIQLSYDTGDQIEEFNVEFQVQYWTAGETTDLTGIVLT
jgi:hypothetical protein